MPLLSKLLFTIATLFSSIMLYLSIKTYWRNKETTYLILMIIFAIATAYFIFCLIFSFSPYWYDIIPPGLDKMIQDNPQPPKITI